MLRKSSWPHEKHAFSHSCWLKCTKYCYCLMKEWTAYEIWLILSQFSECLLLSQSPIRGNCATDYKRFGERQSTLLQCPTQLTNQNVVLYIAIMLWFLFICRWIENESSQHLSLWEILFTFSSRILSYDGQLAY